MTPRRRIVDWWQTRVEPFAEDHPWVTGFLLVGILLACSGLRILIRRGAAAWLDYLAFSALLLGWVAVPVFAWTATGWYIDRRRRQVEELREKHVCLHCGYDLRATPEGCPECGKRPDDPVDG
jgi:hypothetical protein